MRKRLDKLVLEGLGFWPSLLAWMPIMVIYKEVLKRWPWIPFLTGFYSGALLCIGMLVGIRVVRDANARAKAKRDAEMN